MLQEKTLQRRSVSGCGKASRNSIGLNVECPLVSVLTISVGVAAVAGYSQLAIEQGFKQAEAALLEAKKHKNTVFLYRRMNASGTFNPDLDSQKSIPTSSQ